MERSETHAYLERRLSQTGAGRQDVFSADAPAAVHRLTDGIPRLVNQICDHALILAFAAGRRVVDAALIEEAWADLQQLPAPWTSSGAGGDATQETVVEFGDLDGDEEEPEAIPFLSRAEDPTTRRAQARLDQSQALLDRLDEEFTPAGSIGPEVEMSFDVKIDPFDEAFAEEEIVIDRYALLDTDLFAGCPIVASEEGRILGVSLAAAAHDVRLPEPAVWPPSAREGGVLSTQVDTTGAFISTLAIGASDRDRQSVAGGGRGDALGQSDMQPALTVHAASEAHAGRRFDDSILSESDLSENDLDRSEVGSGANLDSDDVDSDLIVFDDESPATTPMRPRQPVRRQEYRQLFAKLRRG